jgi:lambda family phage portal protein
MAGPIAVIPPATQPASSASTWRATASHRGADRLSQELGGWHPALLPASRELLPERDDLVARSRDLIRNDGYAAGAQQSLADSVIGTGWTLVPMPNWEALGISFEAATEWSTLVEAKWRAWADDPACWIDAARRRRFADLQMIAFLQWFQTGEHLCLAKHRMRGGAYGTYFQPVDPDRLSNPHGRSDSPTLQGGVEIDEEDGAPLAYWIRRGHPNDYTNLGKSWQWTRVPRETEWGRPLVVHGFRDHNGDGLTRGKPPLAAVIEPFRLNDVYARNEAQAAILNAIFAAVMQMQSGIDPEIAEKIMGAESVTDAATGQERTEIRLQGVRVPQLPPGMEIKFLQAQRPVSNFGSFVEAVLRKGAAGAGTSYEQLARDFSKTNYSSARAALLEAWRFVCGTSGFFATTHADHAYALWLEEAIDTGEVVLPKKAPGFYEMRSAWCDCEWIGPGRGWIDPTKEAQASQMRLDAMLSTLQRECAEQGLDWKRVLRQRKAEQIERERLGFKEPGPAFYGVQHASDREQQQPAAAAAA